MRRSYVVPMSGDIGGCSARKALKPKFSPSGKIPTVEPGIEPGTS